MVAKVKPDFDYGSKQKAKIEFRSDVIERTAFDLNQRADHLVRNYTAAGILAGVGLAYIMVLFGDWRPYALIFGVISGMYGRFQANKVAFDLRFQAQMLLCQLQTEKNTKATAIYLSSLTASQLYTGTVPDYSVLNDAPTPAITQGLRADR